MGSSMTPSLELAFEGALRKLDMTVKDESARRLNLRLLLLQTENDELRSQLHIAARTDKDQRQALRQAEQAQAQLVHANGQTARTIADLKKRLDAATKVSNRAAQDLNSSLETGSKYQTEMEVLWTEITAERREASKVHEAAQKEVNDNQRRLNEAVQITSHVRSDLERQQKAAKIRETNLESRLKDITAELVIAQDALIVCRTELDLERRTLSNKATDESRDTHIENQLNELRTSLDMAKGELKACQIDLATTIRDADQERKGILEELKESKGRVTEYESKIDLLRAKMQSTKDQLKESRAAATQARTVTAKLGEAIAAKDGRKKAAPKVGIDNSIGTPDGVAARGGKRHTRGRLEQTFLGEKSTFSITPYLNRTVNIPLEVGERRLSVSEGEMAHENLKSTAISTTPQFHACYTRPAKKVNGAEEDSPALSVLAECKPTATNRKAAQRPVKKRSKVIGNLMNVEEVDENGVPQEVNLITKLNAVDGSNQQHVVLTDKSECGEQKKLKKRKFLSSGKTIFDEEDGDSFKRVATKIAPGLTRALGKGGFGQRSALNSGMSITGNSGNFSPLKKDRRGINASFLG